MLTLSYFYSRLNKKNVKEQNKQLQNQNTASLKFSCIVIHDLLNVFFAYLYFFEYFVDIKLFSLNILTV